MSDVEKLKLAARLIAEVQAKLDPDEQTCDGCGHIRYGNWEHKNARDVLAGARNRVDKAIKALLKEKEDGV